VNLRPKDGVTVRQDRGSAEGHLPTAGSSVSTPAPGLGSRAPHRPHPVPLSQPPAHVAFAERRCIGALTLVSETAHALNSGWKETESTASLVTALIARYSPNRVASRARCKWADGFLRLVGILGDGFGSCVGFGLGGLSGADCGGWVE
jgi:hypothetical protein